ncbi:unnamed protein product, partial [Prorocentrum cordatum]
VALQQPRVMSVVTPQRQVVVVQQQAPVRPAAAAPPAPCGAVALAPHRTPEWSAGAGLHGTGECRPCAWFWKPQGCAHARECNYCHMCPDGELKARKREKASHMRGGRA